MVQDNRGASVHERREVIGRAPSPRPAAKLVTAGSGPGGPAHLAVILDGNRRWARARDRHPAEGHVAGLAKVPEFLGWCEEEGLRYVTLWLLSPDNLNRRWDELAPLFSTLEDTVRSVGRLQRWRVRHLGNPAILPTALAEALAESETSTREIAGMGVNLAVGYGGREDVLFAIQRMIAQALEGGIAPDQLADWVSAERLADELGTGGQPDPDLIIRTSGEYRLSGFLTWQAARAEFYFSPTLWPDFSQSDLREALRSYRQRNRRFGA
ncbi:polyprenyl diphosphate synthase [Streptomyces sp. NPDC000075]|uniref:polyprenyl diphosphate synthase n=1 Tax=Streptomyces TaxID=1883 RepID=UPI0031D03DCB